MSAELPPNPPKTRSFAFSIGQLTFGSFLLVLAVIIITRTASVIAIRHIDQTFAELQRLQSVGDLAEDIDRRMNELRLAARDFVTDPGTQSMPGGGGRHRAERAPEEDPAGACARAAGHDRRRHRAACRPIATASSGFPSLINRRADLIVGSAAAARKIRHGHCRYAGSGPAPRPCFRPKAGSLRRCWRATRRPPKSGRAKHARRCESPIRSLRRPSTITPRRSSRYRIRERQIADIDKEVLGSEGRLIGRVTELLREVSARRSHVLSRDLARTLAEDKWQSIVLGTAGVLIGLWAATVRGAADRASAGLDRDLDPRAGGRRRRTPRFRPPMSTTRSAISRGPPKCSAAPWSRPTRRARRRCTRWPSSGWPRKATASCSKVRSTAST